MKIARFESSGTTMWGEVDVEASQISPVRGSILDWGSALMSGGELERIGPPIALGSVHLLVPMEPISKCVGTGTNYMAHLERLGITERPPQPTGYFKPFSALVNPGATIAYPSVTNQLDYELELVAVVGRAVTTGRGTADVVGYTIGNDVSARDAKLPIIGGPDLFTMKGLDRSTPLGPWITTADELGGAVQPARDMSLRVNGEERQRDNTGSMIWTIDELMDWVIERTSLSTGDILFTGTTAGVGLEDGRFLEPGDIVEAEIDGLGILSNLVGPRR